jgi:uncharacterized protein (DUF1697 family)
MNMTDKKNYAALLRGINVGGHSIIKMAELKKQFESIGLSDVRTYIQSGNVVFTTTEKDTGKINLKLKKHLQMTVGFNKEIFILTPEELRTSLKHCPFEPELNDERQLCYIMFMSDKPGKQQINKLMELKGKEYSFAFYEKLLYIAYPREYGGNRRNINFEKVLGVTGTARTWKVVSKLIELCGE